MSERELNKKWLKEQLKDFTCSEELIDKILDLLSEQYKEGLHQGWFDKQMDIAQVINYANEILKAENPPYLDVVLETIKEMLGGK